MPVRAITFDYWRTLFKDAEGEERRKIRLDALIRLTGVREDIADKAMRMTMREFMRVHVEEQRTLKPQDAIPLLELILGRQLSPVADELIDVFGTSILQHSPVPIDGAFDAVRAAAERVPIGIISDTGISPGSSLETLLDRHGMRGSFRSFTFSDVVGVSKPQAAMYHHAANALNVPVTEILHIGDLEPTDVAGALNVGAHAALFAGDNDRFLGATKAQHTFVSWREFVEQLAELLNGRDE
jgi:putative hydrolase of the HAD superfamily